jgi:hypothetical protein
MLRTFNGILKFNGHVPVRLLFYRANSNNEMLQQLAICRLMRDTMATDTHQRRTVYRLSKYKYRRYSKDNAILFALERTFAYSDHAITPNDRT